MVVLLDCSKAGSSEKTMVALKVVNSAASKVGRLGTTGADSKVALWAHTWVAWMVHT
jgi:hypothetical protein